MKTGKRDSDDRLFHGFFHNKTRYRANFPVSCDHNFRRAHRSRRADPRKKRKKQSERYLFYPCNRCVARRVLYISTSRNKRCHIRRTAHFGLLFTCFFLHSARFIYRYRSGIPQRRLAAFGLRDTAGDTSRDDAYGVCGEYSNSSDRNGNSFTLDRNWIEDRPAGKRQLENTDKKESDIRPGRRRGFYRGNNNCEKKRWNTGFFRHKGVFSITRAFWKRNNLIYRSGAFFSRIRGQMHTDNVGCLEIQDIPERLASYAGSDYCGIHGLLLSRSSQVVYNLFSGNVITTDVAL